MDIYNYLQHNQIEIKFNMPKMLVCRGIPSSGKSFIAKQLNESLKGIILSTDSVLYDSTGQYLFSADYMGLSHALNQAKCKEVCRRGLNVIIDNTNTTTKEVQPYYDIAMEYGYDFEMVLPSTSWMWDVEECFKRNTHNVPLETIQRMRNRFESNEKVLNKLKQKKMVEPIVPYLPLQDKPACLICDLDGTLSNFEGIRGPYDTAQCEKDKVNEQVANALYHYSGYIILMSGRDSKFRPQTENWLNKHNIYYNALLMRKEDDLRRDSTIKLELFNEYIRGKYNVECVYDDRLSVIRECWQKLGVWVFNCNQTMKEF